MILAICREHGQGLSWWRQQPRSDQLLMLADREIRARESRKR